MALETGNGAEVERHGAAAATLAPTDARVQAVNVTLAYQKALASQPDLWCKFSEKYINWRQLEILGLMSKGNWA